MSRILGRKVAGGILPLVLGISIISAGLCSSLITYSYYLQLASRKMELTDVLDRNCNSGIEYLLATDVPKGETMIVDLFGDKRDSVRLRKDTWGLYDVISAEAFQGVNRSNKICMIGTEVDSLHQSSLYLSEAKVPLYLTGDTKIKGTAYLSKSGIRSGAVNGIGFNGSRLLDGRKKESSSKMPTIRDGVNESLSFLFNSLGIAQGYTEIGEGQKDSINHAFSESQYLLLKEVNGIILNGFAKGKIIIFSNEKITVTENAKLEDVLLVAPKIEVLQNFKGAIQVFATDLILIGENVRLEYPSALVLRPRGGSNKIELSEKSTVIGDILIEESNDGVVDGILVVKHEAVIEGFAHIEGSVQILGQFSGHLSCKKFQLETEGESFGNYIKDAVLDYSSKPIWIQSSGLWNNVNSVIMKRLNR